MYILVSVPNEAFHRVMGMRALQRQLGIDASVNRDSAELFRMVEASAGGRLVLLDWSKGAILADLPLSGASGLAVNEGFIFASSWTGHRIHVLRGRETDSTVSHPWFNHLHSVELTTRNTLLVASAGNDSLLEIALDGTVLWHWFGPDHGYKASDGNTRSFDPNIDYRELRRS